MADHERHSSFIEIPGGPRLFYRDWGVGKPIVCAARWGTYSDMWQYAMLDLNAHGFRTVAYDRRCHGRSSDTGGPFDYDTLADDLAAVMETLDLRGATLLGNSMGCGEIVRYLARHGAKRVERAVLVAPTTPFLLRTSDNPEGVVTCSEIEEVRAAVRADLPGMCRRYAPGFFGTDLYEVSSGMQEWTLQMIANCSLQALHATIGTYSETDLRPDLCRIDIPSLVISGTRDTVAPPALGRMTATLLSRGIYKEYENAPHGLLTTHRDRVVEDVVAFFNQSPI